MSPVVPQSLVVTVLVPDCRIQKSGEPETATGRKTAASAFPSPSQSEGVSVSVAIPKLTTLYPLDERSWCQLPSEPRKTATSVFPSPSKSPRERTVWVTEHVKLPTTRTSSMYQPGFAPDPTVLSSAPKRNRN